MIQNHFEPPRPHTYFRRYICLTCGHVDESYFYKRWNVGHVWREKCSNCCWSVPDGKCAYTLHMIIFNPRSPSKILVL